MHVHTPWILSGVLSASGPIRRAGGGGGGGGGYGRVSGSPGYSTVVEFMRTDINRQRKLSTQLLLQQVNKKHSL